MKVLLVLSFITVATPSYAGDLERAIQAALEGPEIKKLKIHDHRFNVKPLEIRIKEENGTKTVTATGHISHHLSLRPDDQIHYTIVIHDGRLMNVLDADHIIIDRGGLAGLAGPAGAAIAGAFGVPLSPETITDAGRAAGKLIDGSWEGACRFLIFNIALEVAHKYKG